MMGRRGFRSERGLVLGEGVGIMGVEVGVEVEVRVEGGRGAGIENRFLA